MNWTAIGVIGGFVIQTIVVVVWVSSKLSRIETLMESLSKSIDSLSSTAQKNKDDFWSRNEASLQIANRDKEIDRIIQIINVLSREFSECRATKNQTKEC